jgi:hypothetical protein
MLSALDALVEGLAPRVRDSLPDEYGSRLARAAEQDPTIICRLGARSPEEAEQLLCDRLRDTMPTDKQLRPTGQGARDGSGRFDV